jgi:hypothetical protein
VSGRSSRTAALETHVLVWMCLACCVHPRVCCAAVRGGAALAAARLTVTPCCAQENEQQPKEKPKGPVHMSLAKRLAHNDLAVRNKAVKMMTLWLIKREVAASDMLKLWKGLFYCYWMSDKAPVQARLAAHSTSEQRIQDELAEKLCSIVHQLGATHARRAWAGGRLGND